MKILAIGAHPDDMEFGCGGAFCKAAAAGHEIHMLVMSCGEAGGDGACRRKEQEIVAKTIGARIHWGGFHDTEISNDRALIAVVESRMREIEPDVVLSHYPDDSHQDHRNLSQAVISAARYVGDLLFYEVPSSRNFNPTLFINIGPVIQKKYELLKLHKSQVHKTRVPHLSILESARSMAIYRGNQARAKYAEGFVPYRVVLPI
jgi:LmbE family N-acetylglucosaminyl deacetylase